jgi:hypothetical protein
MGMDIINFQYGYHAKFQLDRIIFTVVGSNKETTVVCFATVRLIGVI